MYLFIYVRNEIKKLIKSKLSLRYISFYSDFFGTDFTLQCGVNKDGGKFDVRLLRNESPKSVERASFASVLSQISWRAWRSRFRPQVLFVCLDIVAVAKTNCITGCRHAFVSSYWPKAVRADFNRGGRQYSQRQTTPSNNRPNRTLSVLLFFFLLLLP